MSTNKTIAIKLFAGAALCAGLATLHTTPAHAADTEIGSVLVSALEQTDVRWSRFGGPVERLTFIPVTDAVNCAHITINYANGDSSTIFRGHIARGASTTISLPPPNPGDVHDVTFACRAENIDGARIVLAGVTDNWPRGWDRVDEVVPARVEARVR